jgi:hypothetical protein
LVCDSRLFETNLKHDESSYLEAITTNASEFGNAEVVAGALTELHSIDACKVNSTDTADAIDVRCDEFSRMTNVETTYKPKHDEQKQLEFDTIAIAEQSDILIMKTNEVRLENTVFEDVSNAEPSRTATFVTVKEKQAEDVIISRTIAAEGMDIDTGNSCIGSTLFHSFAVAENIETRSDEVLPSTAFAQETCVTEKLANIAVDGKLTNGKI